MRSTPNRPVFEWNRPLADEALLEAVPQEESAAVVLPLLCDIACPSKALIGVQTLLTKGLCDVFQEVFRREPNQCHVARVRDT